MKMMRKIRTTYRKPFGYVVFPACGHVAYVRCDPDTTPPPETINCEDCIVRAKELPTRDLALMEKKKPRAPRGSKIKSGARVVVVGRESEGVAIAQRYMRDVAGWWLDRRIGGYHCWPPESLKVQV